MAATRVSSGDRRRVESGQEAGAFFERGEAAGFGSTEEAEADAGDEAVAGVADGARDDAEQAGEGAPSAADVEEASADGFAADVEAGVIDEDEGAEVVGLVVALEVGVGVALEWCEAEACAAVVRHDPSDAAVAEAALTVVEEDGPVGRVHAES